MPGGVAGAAAIIVAPLCRSCSCSRQRVGNMMRALGEKEVRSVVAERGTVEVSCDYCGQQYLFDSVDAAQLFAEPGQQPPAAPTLQ